MRMRYREDANKKTVDGDEEDAKIQVTSLQHLTRAFRFCIARQTAFGARLSLSKIALARCAAVLAQTLPR